MLRKLIVLCAVLSLSILAFGQEKSEAPKAEIFGVINSSMRTLGSLASAASI